MHQPAAGSVGPAAARRLPPPVPHCIHPGAPGGGGRYRSTTSHPPAEAGQRGCVPSCKLAANWGLTPGHSLWRLGRTGLLHSSGSRVLTAAAAMQERGRCPAPVGAQGLSALADRPPCSHLQVPPPCSCSWRARGRRVRLLRRAGVAAWRPHRIKQAGAATPLVVAALRPAHCHRHWSALLFRRAADLRPCKLSAPPVLRQVPAGAAALFTSSWRSRWTPLVRTKRRLVPASVAAPPPPPLLGQRLRSKSPRALAAWPAGMARAGLCSGNTPDPCSLVRTPQQAAARPCYGRTAWAWAAAQPRGPTSVSRSWCWRSGAAWRPRTGRGSAGSTTRRAWPVGC